MVSTFLEQQQTLMHQQEIGYAELKAGGATFEKKLKIETVMPNRLKINLDFGNTDALGKKHNGINGTLTAKWLFGATAQNLKARVDAQLYKKKTTVPQA